MSLSLDIIINNIGGYCPVQATGTIDGQPFYFRARDEHWSIEIGGGKCLNFTDPLLPEEGFYIRQQYSEEKFAAGWMEQAEVCKFIQIAARAYANRSEVTSSDSMMEARNAH